MAYCSLDSVPYLPTPWRDLQKLDEKIIQDLSTDRAGLNYFIDWLNRMASDRFIENHPTLCRGAISLLTEEEKNQFSKAAQKVSELAQNNVGSDIFFSGYDWLGLPERWRGPDAQEQEMIRYLEKNEADLGVFYEGLTVAKEDFCGLLSTYPRASLAAVAMMYRYNANNPAFMNTLAKVQKAVRSRLGESFNVILTTYGCPVGLSQYRGWLLENDPTSEIIDINKKILHIETKIRKQNGPELPMKAGLGWCHMTLRDLARPWRVSSDPPE